MEQITITKPDGTQINLNSKETGTYVTKGEQKRTLLAEDTVSISLSSVSPLNIEIGDKAVFFGKTYKINKSVTPTKKGESQFEYDIEFESVQYDLLDVMYFDCDAAGLFTRSDFALTGNLRFFLEVLINNTNRVFGSGVWVLGECPETDYKDMTFSNQSCLAVLQSLCEKDNGFNQEFDIVSIDGVNTINIRQQGVVLETAFEYGKGNGLYSLKRQAASDSNILTKLFAFGGTTNLKSGYRNFSTRLKLPVMIGNDQSFIQNDLAVKLFGVKEATKEFDDIYPNRIGTVSSISDNILEFFDTSMNFDLKEKDSGGNTKWLVNGTSPKIHFNTGNLAGYEFDTDYDHSTKKFTIKSYKDERGTSFPSSTNTAFRISAGDKYVILNIVLPDSYVTEAESKLLVEAQKYLNDNSRINVQYSLTIDELYLAQINNNIEVECFAIGDSLHLKDSDFKIDDYIRIQSFTRDILNPFKYTLTLSNSVQVTRIERVFNALKQTEKVIKMNNLLDPAKARRSWKDMEEMKNMVFDPDGQYFTDKIKPLSIDTSLLTVGTRASNLTLSSTFTANYSNDKAKFFATTGVLAHLSIEENVRQWTMSQLYVTGLIDLNAYYLYARCPIAGTTGTFVLDTEIRKIDNEGSYYTFPIGIVHSVNEGYREVSLTYGSAAIYGRSIKAGQVVNTAGEVFLDIDKREIYGKVTFKASDGSYKDVTEVEAAAADASAKVDNIKIGGRNLLRNSTTLGLSAWHSDNGTSIFTTQKFNKDAIVIQPTVDGGSAYVLLNLALKENEYYMFSVDVFGTTPCNLWVYDTIKGFGGVDGDKPARITIPFQYKSSKTPAFVIAISNSAWSNVLQNFQLEEGNKATSYSLAPEDIDASIATAQATATAAQTSANAANSSVGSLNTYVDGAFKDGVIDTAEAAAIDKLNKQINSDFDKAINDYNVVYTNSYLFGTPKTDLLNAKVTLAGAKDSLQNSINTAIADGRTTPAEKADVDSKFATYKAAFTDYQTKLSNANKATQDVLKSYSDAAQSTADNIKIGGRNLLRNTLLNSSYAATSTPVERMRFTITQNLIIGQQYTFQIKAKVATANTLLFITLTSIEDSGVMWGFRQEVHVTPTNTEYCTYTFTTTISANLAAGKVLVLYQEGGCAACIVDYVQLEEGNKATGHSLAPEDIDASIATAQATADSKAKHFYGTANPTTPYVQGRDLWTNGTDLFECAVTRLTGAYVANDFVKATGYDNTQTTIDGGMVTSGTVQLAGDAATILAGITGQGTASTSVRIWSGASFGNRATASFRVLQSGDVFSKGAYQVQNQNNITNAGFSGEGTAATSVRIWGGATYENRATAPFRVLQDGTVVATTMQLGSSGQGWSIGNVGNMTCFVGGSLADAYLVMDDRLRSGGYKNSAKIGTQVWSSASGIRGTAAFEALESNAYGYNIATYSKAVNGLYNFSFLGTGGKAAAPSFISTGQYIHRLQDGITNVMQLENGNIVQVVNASGTNRYFFLPSLTNIRDVLNLSTPFCIEIKISIMAESTNSALIAPYTGSTLYGNQGESLSYVTGAKGDSYTILAYTSYSDPNVLCYQILNYAN